MGYRNTWRDFTWDTNYTLSTNQNKIVSLANNVINYATGERFSIDRLNMGGLGDALFLLQEGVRWVISTPAAICATTRTTPFTSTRTEMWLRRRFRM